MDFLILALKAIIIVKIFEIFYVLFLEESIVMKIVNKINKRRKR